MGVEPGSEALAEQQQPAETHWNLAQRIAFRFAFIYLVLFFLTGQEIRGSSFIVFRKYQDVWKTIVPWVAAHILHIGHKIGVLYTGGDTTYDWILILCYASLAIIGTLIWSLLDRRRPNYRRLNQWFRLLLRFSLSLGMISYGTSKAIPTQMPDPDLGALMTRVGDFNPMYLLWTSIGASPVYEVFTGLAELLGGLLLLVPRTVLLGALICVADMTMVFTLDIGYNVPVKIWSFHFLLMGIVLVAPDLPRLANLFLFNRRVEPASRVPFFSQKRLNWIPQIFLLLFGLYSVATGFSENYKTYKQFHPSVPPLYGVWEVQEYSDNGQIRPPLMTDTSRWQRLFLDKPDVLTIKMMSGPSQSYWVQVDMQNKKLTLGHYQTDADGNPVFDDQFHPKKNPVPSAQLSFEESKPGIMTVDGELDGHKTHAKLHQIKFALTDGGAYHWVNEYPSQ